MLRIVGEAACWAVATCRAPSATETTINIEIGCGSLLKIIHVIVEDTTDKLSELNVTDEAVDELDELVVDDEVKNLLWGGSSSSLRTWNRVDNQLGFLAENVWSIKGYFVVES